MKKIINAIFGHNLTTLSGAGAGITMLYNALSDGFIWTDDKSALIAGVGLIILGIVSKDFNKSTQK